VVCSLNFLLVLLAFLVKPGSPQPSTGDFVESVSWSYGSYVGLAVAAVAVAGAISRRLDPEVVIPGAPRPPRMAHAPVAKGHVAPQPGFVRPAPAAGAPIVSVAPSPVCSNCGAQNIAGRAFCTSCGRRLELDQPPACAVCGAPLLAGDQFCTGCGTAVSDSR
jgi:hypothetical protein